MEEMNMQEFFRPLVHEYGVQGMKWGLRKEKFGSPGDRLVAAGSVRYARRHGDHAAARIALKKAKERIQLSMISRGYGNVSPSIYTAKLQNKRGGR